jgi:hypothetical protein
MTDITVEDSATVDASDVAVENPGESGLDAVDELLALPRRHPHSEGRGLVGDITARRSVKPAGNG